MKKNIIDTLIPAVSLEVIRFNASEILNDKEPALRALKTDKSVIVNSQTEAFEIAEKGCFSRYCCNFNRNFVARWLHDYW